MAIRLGEHVTDKFTGAKGIAIARTTWLHGCNKVRIQPPIENGGKPADCFYVDEQELTENTAEATPAPTILGKVAQDSITGFKGVVIAYTEYLYSCPRVSIQPQGLSKGIPIEVRDFDLPQLKGYRQEPVKSGGPNPVAPARTVAPR